VEGVSPNAIIHSVIIYDPRISSDELSRVDQSLERLQKKFPETIFENRIEPDNRHNPYFFDAYRDGAHIVSRGGDSPEEAECRISRALEQHFS